MAEYIFTEFRKEAYKKQLHSLRFSRRYVQYTVGIKMRI